jgi:hypothetical protein
MTKVPWSTNRIYSNVRSDLRTGVELFEVNDGEGQLEAHVVNDIRTGNLVCASCMVGHYGCPHIREVFNKLMDELWPEGTFPTA